MKNGRSLPVLLLLFVAPLSASAFVPPSISVSQQTFTTTSRNARSSVSLNAAKEGEASSTQARGIIAIDRRGLFGNAASASVAAAAAVVVAGHPRPAFAAGAPPTKDEIQRIRTGYDGVVYLLNNFEKETTVCRENGGECKRDADAVRKYLGLRSTTDPLFQIEKVFNKVKYMDDLDPDKLDAFFEATEEYNTAMNMSNSMAFISQFGEYNPGGGKDEVLKYLNEAQIQVVLAEKALKTILDCVENPAS